MTTVKNKLRFLAVLAALLPLGAYAQEVLEQSVVTARASGISISGNLITYDVSQDSLAAVKSLGSLMTNMPLVTYDNVTKSLSVDGSSNICILLNGKKSLVINAGNYSYISELLRGRHLKSIKIDTAPQGIWYGYSAVIDIIAGGSFADFYAASAEAYLRTDRSISPAVSFTGSTGRLTSNVSYKGDFTDRLPEWHTTESRTSGQSEPLYMASDTVDAKSSSAHNVALDLSYDISEKDLLFVGGSFGFSSSESEVSSLSNYGGTALFSKNINSGIGRKGAGSISYQHYFDTGLEKLLSLQYSIDASLTSNTYGRTASDNRYTNRQQTVSADYLHTSSPTFSWNLSSAWFNRNYGSTSGGSGILDHRQDVLRNELNATKRAGKLMLTALAAYDYTLDRADFYNGEAPVKESYGLLRYQLRATWFPRIGHSLLVSASRDVYRPDIALRNPYSDESVYGAVTRGNPLLGNEKINQVLAKYTYMRGSKLSASLTFTYRGSREGILATTSLLDDGRLCYSYENGIGQSYFALSPGFMWRPGRNVMINAYYRIGTSRYTRDGESVSFISHAANLYSNIGLWKGGQLSLLATLMTPAEMQDASSAQTLRLHYLVDGRLSLTQKIGQTLLIGGYVDNPWYSRTDRITEYSAAGVDFYSVSSLQARTVGLFVRCTFGNLGSRVKQNSRLISDTDRTKPRP